MQKDLGQNIEQFGLQKNKSSCFYSAVQSKLAEVNLTPLTLPLWTGQFCPVSDIATQLATDITHCSYRGGKLNLWSSGSC